MKLPRSFTYSVFIIFNTVVLLPVGYMFLSPFWTDQPEQLGNILNLFDSRQLTLVINSITLATGTACLSLIIGVPFAFLCCRTDLKGKNLFGWIYIIPVLIPPYIHAIIWTHLNHFLEKYLYFDIHSLPGAVIVLTCAYFPFVVLMTLTGLKSIDRNLEEASLICHGKFQTLRRITLPLAMPHIISGAIFVFIFSIINVSVPDFLRVKAYPLEIFIQFSAFYNNIAATILSLPLICITFFCIVIQKLYMKDRSYVQISGGVKKRITFHLGRFHSISLFFCVIVIILSTLLPIVVLSIVAGPISNYSRAFSTSINQIGYSFLLAFSGSLVTLIVGFSLAYLIKRSTGKLKEFLSWAVLLPLAIPATTIGIGLIGTWNRVYIDIIYSSSLIIIMGYVARFIPFAVIVLVSGLTHVSHHLEEAALLAGSSFLNLINKIVVPLSKKNILAVLFIIFILAFGELGTTLLIIPPGRETIPIKIYNLMHYGADQLVAALCLIFILIIFAISAVFLICYRKMVGVNRNVI